MDGAWRCGIGDNPIDEDQNLFNIIAPGVVKNHVTLGFTYSPDQYSEISVNYMHAFHEDQSYTYQGQLAMGPFAGANYDTPKSAWTRMHSKSATA